MRNAVTCAAIGLAAAFLTPVGVASKPGAGANAAVAPAGEFAFAFVVGRHGAGGIYPEEAGAPAPMRPGTFAEGQVLTGPALVDALSTGSAQGAPGTGSAFKEAELIAHVHDLQTGEISSAVVAMCPTLDFETNVGSPFEQQVVCGKDRFAYAGTSKGIEITRAGETALSFRLEAGLYTLNGVPFLVGR
jgi:hypothetical protein